MLLFLHPEDRVRFCNAAVIDQIISAKMPTADQDPDGKLFDVISLNMIHGPCGNFNPNAVCMVRKNGQLKYFKQFPKPFQETTVVHKNGYSFYQRRLHGRTHNIQDLQFPTTLYVVNNQWVVPHSPYLSRQYQAHINVEFCGSVKAIKYLHKYVYKRANQTTVALNLKADEVARHLSGQYIGPTKGAWRLFEFPMYEKFLLVQELAVHLPEEQVVYFNPNLTSDSLQEKMESARSTLMAFFLYNHKHYDGCHLLYQEFPTQYVYDLKQRRWHLRQNDSMTIGRMFHNSPTAGEKYYVRLLFTAVKGPQLFKHL